MYIHEQPGWPDLIWNNDQVVNLLAEVRYQQGLLLGKMNQLGFDIQLEASLDTLATSIVQSSAIENELLDKQQVRSSLAKKLGVNLTEYKQPDRHIDGIVEMMLDATHNAFIPLTKERLFAWHNTLFPTGYSGLHKITVGSWRTEAAGSMQVISGPIGNETVHFEAPEAKNLGHLMDEFFCWLYRSIKKNTDPIMLSAISHFKFVTIHPFEDGNGRIARAISDYCLARADQTKQRFYSMSAQIRQERDGYYDILEKCQKGSLDITPWLTWYLNCLNRAILSSDKLLHHILTKSKVWQHANAYNLNDRQKKIINKLLDDFEGNLTNRKYAKLAKCSADTALRDITALIEHGILEKAGAGGRSTHYLLKQQ